MTARFCYTCGHRLAVTKYVSYYDETTGLTFYDTTYVCPHERWSEMYHYKTSTEAYVYAG